MPIALRATPDDYATIEAVRSITVDPRRMRRQRGRRRPGRAHGQRHRAQRRRSRRGRSSVGRRGERRTRTSGAGTVRAPAPATGSMPEPPRDAGTDAGDPDAMMCLEVTQPCANEPSAAASSRATRPRSARSAAASEGAPCATANGEDCCGDLLCIAGRCGYELDDACERALHRAHPRSCSRATARRDRRHRSSASAATPTTPTAITSPRRTCRARTTRWKAPPTSPVCEWHAAAIDIGMDWPASRDWLRWLIAQIQSGRLTGHRRGDRLVRRQRRALLVRLVAAGARTASPTPGRATTPGPTSRSTARRRCRTTASSPAGPRRRGPNRRERVPNYSTARPRCSEAFTRPASRCSEGPC